MDFKKETKRRERMTPARKAVATRKKRQAFEKKYGRESYNVISMMQSGLTNDQVADIMFFVPFSSIYAYRANFTRGVYGDTSFLPKMK